MFVFNCGSIPAKINHYLAWKIIKSLVKYGAYYCLGSSNLFAAISSKLLLLIMPADCFKVLDVPFFSVYFRFWNMSLPYSNTLSCFLSLQLIYTPFFCLLWFLNLLAL